MSESRQINFSVNIDTSQVPKQAELTTKQIRSELEKQKANVEKILSDIATSGGKLKVPVDQFKAAITATGNALDSMGTKNEQTVERLQKKYGELEITMKKAWYEGNPTAAKTAEKTMIAINRECKERQSLGNEIRQQLTALKQIDAEVARNVNATQQQTASTQGLTNQSKSLREEIRRISLALAEMEAKGQRGTALYNQLRARGAQLTDQMSDARTQLRLLSHDNAGLQGLMDGLAGVSGGFTAATGAITLFGVENENLQKSMVRLQAVMSITMGLQQVLNSLNKDSAFRLGVVSKVQAWWTACKEKAAASTTAETAAISANTAAQTRQTAAITGATTATAAETTAVTASTAANKANAASWKAIGIAIKSIPFIGWLAIIGAVIAAIYNLTKSTYSAAKAKKELQKATLASNKSAAEELTQLKILYAATQDVTKSIESRRAAAMKMQELYPSVFSSLKTEAILAGEATQAYNQLAESIIKKARAEARQERVKNLENDILDAETKYQNEARKWVAKRLEIQMNNPTGYMNDPEWALANHNVEILQAKYLDPVKDMKKEQEKLTKEIIDLSETPINEMEKAVEGSVANIKAKMDEAERIANASIKSIDASGNITYYTATEKAQARKDYYKYKRQYEAAKFNPKDRTSQLGSADIAGQNAEDTIIKAERERSRLLIQIEREREQARINVIKDFAEKRVAQRKLDEQKEIDAIQQSMERAIENEVAQQKAIWEARENANAKAAEAAGKQYRRKAFNPGEILSADFNPGDDIGNINTGTVDTSTIQKILKYYGLINDLTLQAQAERVKEEQKAQRLAMQEYLRDYGTLEEKKTAIAALYAEKRAQASSDAEKIRLSREENQAYADLGFDEFMRTKASLAFGEIDKLSQKTIGELIQKLEEYKDKATETFDPEKIEKYNQALANLKKAQALGKEGIFGNLFSTDFQKEMKAAQAELKAAEQAHNDLLDKKVQKEQEVADRVQDIIDKVKELTGQEITPDQVKDGASVSGIINTLMGNGDMAGAGQLSGLMQSLNGARAELGSITEASDAAGASFANMGEQFASAFSGADGTLAMVEQIILKINEAIQEAAALMHDLSDTADALGADTEVGSGWNQATTFMDGFAEASQSATDAFEALKSGNPVGVIRGIVGSFTAWIRTFAALHDNSREKIIQNLKKEIDELERINNRIEHRLQKEYSKQAKADYEREIKNLEKQQQLIRQQIAAEQDKKNSDDERIQEWRDQIEQIGYQIEEYKDKAKDAIIGEDISSSINSFVDALSEAWGKTADRAKATKDYVKNMLRQMVQEAMKTDLSAPIEELRKKMTEALNDDVVTDAEKRELEQFAEDLAKTMEKRYGWADDLMKDNSKGQSGATTGTFATASQESISELSGRAAAIHTSGEMRRELLANIWIDLGVIKEAAARGQQTNDEIKGLQLLALGYLEEIAKNTRQLFEMNSRLDKIEKNTRSL